MPHNTDKKPNFFVVGVVKGGTTSLYHYLNQHPEIYLPPIKETNHFAAADIDHEHFLPEYAIDVRIDLDAYIRGGMKEQIHIAHVDDPEHYSALFSKVDRQKAIGEISNSYMICPGSAESIHRYAPHGKIIVVLRNPVRRAWSQYLMNLREAKSDAHDFVNELLNDKNQEHTGWGVNHQYLALGEYATQLKRYFTLFGSERVLPLFFEEYKNHPEEVLQRICHFLDVDPSFDFDFSTESNKAGLPRSASINKILVQSGMIKSAKGLVPKRFRRHFAKILYTDKNLPELSEEARDWLSNYYRDEVKRLEELLGIDIEKWWPEFKTRTHDHAPDPSS